MEFKLGHVSNHPGWISLLYLHRSILGVTNVPESDVSRIKARSVAWTNLTKTTKLLDENESMAVSFVKKMITHYLKELTNLVNGWKVNSRLDFEVATFSIMEP
jgi:hypothetical protein